MMEKKAGMEQDGPASLEDALARLDEIITRMEEGSLPLEELLDDYEEGAKLVQVCQERLKVAEKRILTVTKSLDGSLGVADFHPETEDSA